MAYPLTFTEERAEKWLLQLRNELDQLPATTQMAVMMKRLRALPEPPREAYKFMYLSGAQMSALTQAQWQRSDRRYAMAFGVGTVVFLAIVALMVPEPRPFPMFIFRLIASLGAGAVGAFIPGSLTTSIKRPSFTIRAGGALALAVIVYLINPPALASAP